MSGELPWRPAPQPDIVRAAQKDDLYLQQTVDAAHDAAMRLLGPLAALRHARGVKLLAAFAYHALTTGAGLQTLGEEYCDVVQVAAAGGGGGASSSSAPSPSSGLGGLPPASTRAALVLLQSFGPPLMDRLVASLDRASEEGALPPELFDGDGGGDGGWGGSGGWRGHHSGSGGANGAAACEQEQQQQPPPRPPPSAAAAAAAARRLAAAARARWRRLAAALAPHWPALKQWLLFAGRLHLAAFYLRGGYYEWSKRLAGVRCASVSADRQPRASYAALGWMLLAQLAVSGAMQARPQLAALVRRRQQQQQYGAEGAGAGQQGGKLSALPPSEQQQRQHAVVLPDELPPCADAASWGGGGDDDGQGGGLHLQQQQQEEEARTADAGGGDGGGKECPLCLSARADPTSTACGHVFCWACVAQWCSEKPECPLCRAACAPSQLVCLYHCDF